MHGDNTFDTMRRNCIISVTIEMHTSVPLVYTAPNLKDVHVRQSRVSTLRPSFTISDKGRNRVLCLTEPTPCDGVLQANGGTLVMLTT